MNTLSTGVFYVQANSNSRKALLYSIRRRDDAVGAGSPSPVPFLMLFIRFENGRYATLTALLDLGRYFAAFIMEGDEYEQ